jgi:hypothetical protein
VPNIPVAVTEWFAVEEADDALAGGGEEEEEELQPATAAAASSGIMSSADARRMATFPGPRPNGRASLLA